ncbi:hypothetical protein G5C60_10020 [Streptomyces sp. HC44]|uniref:Uncharacterized protein n=1 Tax=Streptomyces scabichelini TaxID=2711217 RepID=A0A6G4V1U9_9ACTN|nr:hypothetical protein [Streptomyces scabichelini]NGO07976.1 hypothetical protein [Streptomyces scabichelini]
MSPVQMAADSDGMIWSFGSMGFILVCAMLVIWPTIAVWRAKTTMSRESDFKSIAEKAVMAQQDMERELVEVRLQLNDMSDRVKSVERVLKDVE